MCSVEVCFLIRVSKSTEEEEEPWANKLHNLCKEYDGAKTNLSWILVYCRLKFVVETISMIISSSTHKFVMKSQYLRKNESNNNKLPDRYVLSN